MKIASVAFAAFMLAVGVVYANLGMNMPRGSLAYPGPGLFPTIIGALLVATALGCLIQDILGGKHKAESAAAAAPLDATAAAPVQRRTAKTLQLVALLVAYTYLLKPVGFPLAIFAFVAVAIRIFGYRKWLPTLTMAATIAAAAYIAFVVWLKVPLPAGILEPLLG
jgi:putative tricarboxylic transport membrane protein